MAAMGWVSGFENDVFISYARVDNATVENDPERGWVSLFHRHLEVALSKKVGRLETVRIWRDTREISGQQLFDQTIQDTIGRSAIFVALTSRGYLESQYCGQELRSFYAKAKADPIGLAIADNYRIFNLLINNLPQPEWPEEFKGTSGFPLNDGEDARAAGEPSAVGQDKFAQQLREVSQAIYSTLTRLRASNQRERSAAVPQDDQISVFLAETSDTLRSLRRRAIVELERRPDVRLVTGVPPPFPSVDHDARVRDIVQSVDLSVHLLDGLPGREIEGHEEICYPQRQMELAAQHGKSQLVWVPKELSLPAIENQGYSAFLGGLERDPRGEGRSYDFQRDLPSAVPRQIFGRIDDLKSKRATKPAGGPHAALLDTHVKDQLHALELSRYLIEHSIQPYINPQEDDPGRNVAIFTERLKQASILILFCGAVADEWLRARISVALRIAIADECPLQACAVYLAPPRLPETAPKLRLPLISVEWMDHTHGFNAAAVDQLLERARASVGFLASR